MLMLNKKETKIAAVAGAAVTMWALHGCSGQDNDSQGPDDNETPGGPDPDDNVPTTGPCAGQGEFIDLVTKDVASTFDAACITCLNAIDPDAPEIEGSGYASIYTVQEYMTDEWREGAGICGIANWQLRIPNGDGTYGDEATCADVEFDPFVGVMTQRDMTKATEAVLRCIFCLGWPNKAMGDTAAKQDKLNECRATQIEEVTCDNGYEWNDYGDVNKALIASRDAPKSLPSETLDQEKTVAFAGCYVCMWTTIEQFNDESNYEDAYARWLACEGKETDLSNSEIDRMRQEWENLMGALDDIYGTNRVGGE